MGSAERSKPREMVKDRELIWVELGQRSSGQMGEETWWRRGRIGVWVGAMMRDGPTPV